MAQQFTLRARANNAKFAKRAPHPMPVSFRTVEAIARMERQKRRAAKQRQAELATLGA